MLTSQSLPEPSTLKARVRALGMELVVADDGAQFVLGGNRGLDVIFTHRSASDEALDRWLEIREARGRRIADCAEELRRLEADLAETPLQEIIDDLRAHGYAVSLKRNGDFRISRQQEWTEKGVRAFAAFVQLVEPIRTAAGVIEDADKGGDAD